VKFQEFIRKFIFIQTMWEIIAESASRGKRIGHTLKNVLIDTQDGGYEFHPRGWVIDIPPFKRLMLSFLQARMYDSLEFVLNLILLALLNEIFSETIVLHLTKASNDFITLFILHLG
jgi:hypothetical protein